MRILPIIRAREVSSMRRHSREDQFSKGECILVKSLLISILVLIISQGLLFITPTRIYVSRVDQLEGDNTMVIPPQTKPISERVVQNLGILRRSEELRICMIKPAANEQVVITVNGEVITKFNHPENVLTVYEGDYIEIDATALKESAKFVIRIDGKKLDYPINGLLFETNGNIAVVGKVKFHHP